MGKRKIMSLEFELLNSHSLRLEESFNLLRPVSSSQLTEAEPLSCRIMIKLGEALKGHRK